MESTAQVLFRVATLISDGHHRDEIPGLPGVALTGPGAFSNGRRLFQRGTPEFADALANGLLDRLPPPPPPATSEEIRAAELAIGAPLPELLRGMYGLANGEVGPGYGLLALTDAGPGGAWPGAVTLAKEGPWHDQGGLPEGVLPICGWGCAIYSLVDCISGRMYGWDPNPVDYGEPVPLFETEYTLDTWIAAWLAGTLRQPWLIEDPDTGSWRGATIAETAEVFDL